MNEQQVKDYQSKTIFGDSLYNYYKFVSWARWYPDLFLDLLKPKTGGVNLHIDERVFLRCDVRFYSMYGTFSRGYGKCIKGDSLIYTDDGIVEIGDLFNYQSDGVETYYNKKIDVVNRYGELEQTYLGLYNGKQDCITIKTDDGFEITGTKIHKILVMNEFGDIEFRKLSDIRYGDYVLINRKNDCWGNNYDIDVVKELEKYYSVSLEKREIPHCILKASKNIISEFLRNLFDVKGNVNSKTVSYRTFSCKLAKQLQFLLLNYGIIPSLEKEVVENEFGYCYVITISDNNIDLFRKNIGFNLENKKNQLELLCNKKHDSSRDIIPFQYDNVEKLVSKCKLSWNEKRIFNHIIRKDNEITYEQLDFLLQECEDIKYSVEYQYLSFLSSQRYYFNQVRDISSSVEDVYDFYLPKTHSFVSNGIVSHNTLCEVLALWVVAILFPGSSLAISAQTKENAADLLASKSNEILKLFPLLRNELKAEPKFQKGFGFIEFKNDSTIDILANAQSSKGQRRTRLKIEESALLNNALYEDVLEPIPEVPRYTVGELAIADPLELNHQIHFYTTSGFRGSEEYQRSCDMYDDMCDLKGSIVLGANWMLPCYYGRGSNKSQILKKKKTSSPIAFAQNYEQEWVGSSDGALVDIVKLMNCRNLTAPKIKTDSPDDEYYIGVDVARSQSKANNQSAIVVARVQRHKKTGRVIRIDIPYILSVSNIINFTRQACLIKKIKNDFNARMVVVDGNGIGAGLIDELLKCAYDPDTNEYLGCWNTINTDNTPELEDADKCLFDLKAQSVQTKVVTDFIDVVSSEKLHLLEMKNENDFTQRDNDNFELRVLPYVNTDLLFEEIANLKLRHMSNGALSVDKVVRKLDKDRWSALAYVIYYIKEYCDFIRMQDEPKTSNILSMARRPSILSR